MNEKPEDEWMRLSLRDGLTPEEEARLESLLAAHPEFRAAWEEDRALGRALQSLPDVPLSSNFTARVLQAVDRDAAREARAPRSRSWFRILLPRLSWTAAAVLLVFFGVQEYRAVQRLELAKDVSLMEMARLPGADVLQDFDAISRLQQIAATSDEELLQALQ